MENVNKTQKCDMALLPYLMPYLSPETIPLTFKLNGNPVSGIPAGFHPVMRRELLDANISRTTITGRCPDCGLEIKAEYTEYRDFPVTEWVAYFTNTSDNNSGILSDIRIADGIFTGTDPVLTHGNGDNCNESGYEFFTDPVNGDPIVMAPTDGTPCNGAFPYLRLMFVEYGLNIAVGWPAQWEAGFAPAEGGVSFYARQQRCHMYLKPGETIRTPRVTIMGFTGGEDRGRNLWRRWYFAHILPREAGQPLPPKLCLHTWAIEGKPEFTATTEENQIHGISEYMRKGYKPDIWWIDAGWYKCDFDWPRIGTWTHDVERYPNGLDPVGKFCDDNDIQLLLWFEPERVRKGEWLDVNHPEWLIADYRNPEGDRLLNLGDPECCEWLIDHIDGLIKRYHVRIYRQDFNYCPLHNWIGAEAEDRIGAVENAHVQGYLHYWDELLFRNPGLWIDSCASGGRRNELETMRRAVALHYTDVGYGNHLIKQKQHREMFEWMPYFRAHTMNWDNAEGDYVNGGKPVDNFAYQNALAPAVTSMFEYYDPQEKIDIGIRFEPVWRRAADIMLHGDYYPLTECKKDNTMFYAMQFDDPDRRIGFIQVIRNTKVAEDSITLHPKFGAGEYTFENMETGETKVMQGFGLENGFTVTLPPRSGVIWFYRY